MVQKLITSVPSGIIATAAQRLASTTTSGSSATTKPDDPLKSQLDNIPSGDAGKDTFQSPQSNHAPPVRTAVGQGFATHGNPTEVKDLSTGYYLARQFQQHRREGFAPVTPAAADRLAGVLIRSGDSEKRTPVAVGTQLFKIVPEGKPPGAESAFYLPRGEMMSLMRNPTTIADRLALPPGSRSDRYVVYQRTCLKGSEVVESNVAAATLDGKPYARGGARQHLIVDFSDFSPPERWEPPGGWR